MAVQKCIWILATSIHGYIPYHKISMINTFWNLLFKIFHTEMQINRQPTLNIAVSSAAVRTMQKNSTVYKQKFTINMNYHLIYSYILLSHGGCAISAPEVNWLSFNCLLNDLCCRQTGSVLQLILPFICCKIFRNGSDNNKPHLNLCHVTEWVLQPQCWHCKQTVIIWVQ